VKKTVVWVDWQAGHGMGWSGKVSRRRRFYELASASISAAGRAVLADSRYPFVPLPSLDFRGLAL
jgi:hypothetical protein